MEVLHITATKNVSNIMRSKLLRNKPLLSVYNTIMENYYGHLYKKDKGLVFAFPESICNRDKIIKDFIYWKIWGHPRNIFLDKYEDDEVEEKKNIGINLFSDFKLKNEHFSILLLDVEYEDLFGYYLHVQTSGMGVFWTDMDYRYEHDDKPLVLLNYDINPKNIKVIGTSEGIIGRNNKFNISLNI